MLDYITYLPRWLSYAYETHKLKSLAKQSNLNLKVQPLKDYIRDEKQYNQFKATFKQRNKK